MWLEPSPREQPLNLDCLEAVQVFGGCDDTQSAAVGSGSTGEGDAHIYLGTSAWAGITTGKNLKHKNGAVVLQSADARKNLLVGITESAGSNLDWMIEKFYKLEKNDPAIRIFIPLLTARQLEFRRAPTT